MLYSCFCQDRGTGSKAEPAGQGQDTVLGLQHTRGIWDQAGQETTKSRRAFHRQAYGVKWDSRVRADSSRSVSAIMIDHTQQDTEWTRGTKVNNAGAEFLTRKRRVSQRNWKKAKQQVSSKSRTITGQGPCARLLHILSQLNNTQTVPRCFSK